ncbi:23S rRNA (guanosine(2251)-2'-O)-methyltransferase RlmB [Croceicoccus ponticola]|uniref:23S rRNA (Guanosine(2251)-2'-O)-methyltransferase RlmB n=1 Tax=Croceicoccus ponticola TaxID=2217664 RepID=A0A437GVH1_9SPHN|nr:23S rRNA (guanosine(2251)-2'-O)-methyltransferase RlmB [Croceicoccus ponticola]RVQ65739.1 23S rRNA (guanosine(2251)-2'-O)-methyltransferase RlmB [Croceicoccus ponticola]
MVKKVDKRALRGRAGRMQGGRGSGRSAKGAVRIWGRHAVTSALNNPEREINKIWAVRETLEEMVDAGEIEIPDDVRVEYAEAVDLGRLVSRDAPHQNIVIECEPLPERHLADVATGDPKSPVVVLDHVTDPHNVGAIMRSAAAFGAACIVTQDRHAPPESGTLAKSASGALESLPWIRVVNLSRALEELAELGYWRIGLDGDGEQTLADALTSGPVALVLGAEGDGLRHQVGQHCDQIARLPIATAVESLNVSNAAAIALYACAMREQ